MRLDQCHKHDHPIRTPVRAPRSTTEGTAMTQMIPGTIITAAGNGQNGFEADGVPATSTKIGTPWGVTVDEAGNVYVCEFSTHRVRKVTPDGKITTIAGTGTEGYSGDGERATAAKLSGPHGTVIDKAGNIYIADRKNDRIRKVAPDGTITTVAGAGPRGYSGDGGPASAAKLNLPQSLALDDAGNLYIADLGNHRIRKVAPDGKITTVAGTGTGGYSGDGGPAFAAQLNNPTGVTVGKDGNLYIADCSNHRVRKVTPDGTISTVAGNGTKGYSGDGVPATTTTLSDPYFVDMDGARNLYIADQDNHRVRKVAPDGIITTMAGDGVAGAAVDSAPAMNTHLYSPIVVAVAPSGDLYIGDVGSYYVYKVVGASAVVPPAPPVADLYGKYVLPVTAPRGQQFELGATVHNRGPAIASGEDITVVLTLADGLESAQHSNGRRLTRTFTGTDLAPHSASLDGVFRVRATDDATPGVYESTLEIQYGGDLNLKDNTAVLPITVVVPEPIDGEHALIVFQDNLPKAAPGQSARFHLRFLAPVGQPVNPGDLDQRLSAPTGFVFTGRPTYTYPNTALGAITGELKHDIRDDGRTLVIRHNPHLNTTDTDNAPLLYAIDLQAVHDAVPGVVSDGSASIGQRPPVQIRAEVTGTTVQASLRITQTKLAEAHVTPGKQHAYPVSLALTNTGHHSTGAQDLVFTAPEGLWFSEDRLMMAKDGHKGEVELTAERSDGNRTLTTRNATALNLDPGQSAYVYPEMEVETNAQPGAVRVGIQIGNPPFVTGHATVTIDA
ncbi:NHL repeat-containing protein [Streptomyces sp900105245]|uniref:NHL repeat-containing protein n=1 Tax=Streptomyces sp. 900105245 TaxID=3154379 RepID=A0ABV1UKH8_9ACTN